MENDFYGSAVQKLAVTEKCTVYKMKNKTGEGMITRYFVFPGIDLFYNDFHMENGYNMNKLPCANIMEINHCKEGRYECELRKGDCIYLGAGDLSVTMLTTETKSTLYPLSHFHAISITINIPIAVETIRQLSESLGGVAIDIYKIQQKLCSDNSCFVIRGLASVEHIFSELYAVPSEFMQGYFRIKIIELLMFLSSVKETDYQEERRYFHQNQVKTVKHIRKYMIEHIREHITLDQLSEQFNIPLTSMKNCFKVVYGISIYAYMKEYRMQAAATLLRNTSDSITDIANHVGYENPSKFAGVFKERMGVTPSEYRKSLLK